MLAHPPHKKFKELVSTPRHDSGVTAEFITSAKTIFRPNRARLVGATVRKKPARVEILQSRIPREFYVLHQIVSLTADVMFINGFPFLITFSRNIRLITIELLVNRRAVSLSSSLKKIFRLYSRGGFLVKTLLMDMEFECLADEF